MLKQGDKAPSFTLESDSGKKVSSADVKGPLVVYFYPKDDTPGCTVEAKDFAAAKQKLGSLGVTVVGISKDSIASHCKFRDKYKLNFPLLSDPDLTVHKAFGAWGEKTLYGRKFEGVIRSTFVVEGGKVVRAYPSVKVAGHVERILADLGGAKGAPAKKAAPAPAKGQAPKKPAAKKAAPAQKAAQAPKKKQAPKKATPAKKPAAKKKGSAAR